MSELLPYSEALARVEGLARDLAPVLGSEALSSSECVGRIASEALASPESLPPFRSSSMDGFAVRARDLAHASADTPKRLRVLGGASAGDAPRTVALENDGAWEIMTGAPVPEGFDAILPVEDTRPAGQGFIECLDSVEAGQFLRPIGSDLEAGSELFCAGTRLGAQHLLMLAALGIPSIRVLRRPRVAVIATGPELVGAFSSEAPGPGAIRNSTTPFLLEALRALGAEAVSHGSVGDDAGEFSQLLERASSERPDVILTTGAVSMGKHDYVADSFRELGGQQAFHKVAIRPGKPLLFGKLRDAAFFGMPGNPVSTFVALRFFLTPYLRALQGLPRERGLPALLANVPSSPEGFVSFLKARRDPVTGATEILPGQASYQVSPLLRANGWAKVSAGDTPEFFPLLSPEEA